MGPHTMRRQDDVARAHRRLRRRILAATAAGALSLGLIGATGSTAQAAQDLVVNPAPDQSQPRIMNGRVFGIDSAGELVVTGGSFNTIRQGDGSGERTQQWLFMFNQETGRIVDSFTPVLAGPTPSTSGLVAPQPGVQSVQFAEDGQSIYIAGDFTSVNGTPTQRIARLDLDGNLITSFTASANQQVSDLALTADRLIVAGQFDKLNGQPVSRMGSIDPDTGATQTDFNLQATESRDQFAPYVQEIDASPDGRWLGVIGNFQKLGSRARNQAGLIDLTGGPRVADWVTDAYSGDCASVYNDSWARGIDISPDSSFMVISATGAHRGSESFCDSVARWELPSSDRYEQSGNQQATWRDLTGGDTLWANEITEEAVYVGGHQRWMNNGTPSPSGDRDGPGSLERYGIAAMDPAAGVPLSFNPGRARGRGIEAMLVDDQRLFLGSDTDLFNGEIRQRLAVLSTAGGTDAPKPKPVDLPVQLVVKSGSDLVSVDFDGSSFGTPGALSGPGRDGIDWAGLRGGFVQNGELHYFGGANAFYSRPFDGSTFGPAKNLSTAPGYVDTSANLTPYDQPYGVDTTQVAAYENGRIYYRKGNESELYERGYALESGVIGTTQTLASSGSWDQARSLTIIGEWLYAAWNDGNLYRFYAPNGNIKVDTRELVDNGSSGISWASADAMFANETSGTPVPPTAPTLDCAEPNPWKAERWDNQDLQGQPLVTTCETRAGEQYGSGGPGGVGSDNFSLRFTRDYTLTETKSIQIDADADDGVRAYVDGDIVIDEWRDQDASGYTGTSIPLPAGEHTVVIEYYENGGNAGLDTTVTIVDPVEPEGPDNMAGDTTVTTPTNGEVIIPAGPVDIEGTATDNRSVADVRLSVLDRNADTNKWLQRDGSFGAAFETIPVTLDAPGTTASNWAVTVNLPEGQFAAIARTIDGSNNLDESSAYQPFTVTNTGADQEAPAVTVTSPTPQQKVGSSSVGATGTATDNSDVERVRVAVFKKNSNGTPWMQADGTFGANFNVFTANLASPGASSTNWTFPAVELADGDYAFDVRAFDKAGNQTPSSVFRPFTVNTTPPAPQDTQAPTATVTTPERLATVSGEPLNATGTAADDLGVTNVRVAVYNRSDATNRWLQPDGTWGPTYNFYLANLDNPGATSVNWSLPINLPTGKYAVDVKAVDAKGNISSSAYRPFLVENPDGTAPTTMASTGAEKRSAGKRTISGIAWDNQAIRKVQAQVKRVTVKKIKRNGKVKRTKRVKRFLKQNGGWGSKSRWITTELSADLSTKPSWSLTFDKRRNSVFVVKVRAQDANGNRDKTPLRKRFKVGR